MSDRRYRAMPRCVGKYESGHAVCDGSPGRAPCAHRDICVGLRLHSIRNKTVPSDYVKMVQDGKGASYAKPLRESRFHEIIQQATKLSELARPVIVRNPNLAPKKTTPIVPGTIQYKRYMASVSGNARMLDKWYLEWVGMISKGARIPLARLAVEALPGELYVRDKRVHRHEIQLYVRSEQRGKVEIRDMPIAALKWRIQKLRMDVRYPVLPGMFEGISPTAMRELKPQEWRNNAFPRETDFVSASDALTHEQLRMSAQAVVELLNAGVIKVRR